MYPAAIVKMISGEFARLVPVLVTWLALFAAVDRSSAENIKVNSASSGKEIKIKVGDTIQVELQQPGATGYLWELQPVDSRYFSLGKTTTADRTDNGKFVGSPVKKTWSISATHKGKSTLLFLLCRPWEGAKGATDKFVLNVLIADAKERDAHDPEHK